MQIDDNILSVAKAMFQTRENWKYVSNDLKEKYFFIFNRYFSKMYPKESQLINNKLIDKSIGMDLWYYFMISKPYPKWFWSKSKSEKDKEISKSDLELLMVKFNLNKTEDLKYLINRFPDLIEEELKFYKKQIKNG